MAYSKPAATVRQVQRSASFPLPDPTLESCVVGPGYYWQDPSWGDSSVYEAQYDGTELVVSGAYFSEHTAFIGDTIIVDLIKTSGANGTIGSVKHLIKDTDFTVSGENIIVNADLSGYDVDNSDKADVRVGFLAKRDDLTDTFQKITEEQEIRDFIGEPKPWNPLAFGASLALNNGGVSTNIIGTDPGVGGDSGNFGNAITLLESKEKIYAIAPLTRQSAELAKFGTHVTAMSVPAQKKERIVFTTNRVDYSGESTPATNTEKQTVAQAIQDYSSGINNKRFFAIHPDAGYVETLAHVSTLSQDFIQAVYGDQFSLLPKFTVNGTVGDTRYKAFQDITSGIVTKLKDNDVQYITVYYPVPGYFFAPAIAGQTVGKTPAAPLTNSSISGFSGLYKSNNHFNEDQLNTMAEGGTWVLEERGAGSIINRHQLSTKATSIETRELSITTQVDYTAKYLRDLVSPLIGKNVISNTFLSQLEAALVGAAAQLVDEGIVRSINILNVYQDEISPDTVKVDVEIEPLYPANYIKITLVF